jgi:hypothetical protein
LIDTPEGTLRIESEAENVLVELVDEADRTTTVQIDEGENATRLRAGRYRVRLAGKHDNLVLTPDAIDLRRGEERLARITQLPRDVSSQRSAGGRSALDEQSLRATNEELTPTTISVEYEDGRPAMGAEVKMELQGNSERPVVVTGNANAQGVAVNRNLPYGKYTIYVKVPERDKAYWSGTFFDILLEFGESFTQKIVAPTPDKRATVKVHTEFNPAGLNGLRFGKLSGRQGSFMGVVWSPEPDQYDDGFADFPTLGNGISDVALFIHMLVTRSIQQPSGETLEWYWMRGQDFYPGYLLVKDESVVDLKTGWEGDIVFDFPQSEYFRNMPKERGVQYFAIRDWPRGDESLSVELPAGKLECGVRSIFGKATREVIQALGLQTVAQRGIWLEASLNSKSAWVPRGIDLSGWS